MTKEIIKHIEITKNSQFATLYFRELKEDIPDEKFRMFFNYLFKKINKNILKDFFVNFYIQHQLEFNLEFDDIGLVLQFDFNIIKNIENNISELEIITNEIKRKLDEKEKKSYYSNINIENKEIRVYFYEIIEISKSEKKRLLEDIKTLLLNHSKNINKINHIIFNIGTYPLSIIKIDNSILKLNIKVKNNKLQYEINQLEHELIHYFDENSNTIFDVTNKLISKKNEKVHSNFTYLFPINNILRDNLLTFYNFEQKIRTEGLATLFDRDERYNLKMYGSPELIKSIFYKLLDNKNFPLYGKEEISRNLFYVIGHNMFLIIYLKDYFQENKINDKNNKLKIKELFQESILDVSIKPDRFFINQKLNSYKNFSLNKFYQEFENSCNFFEIEEKYIFLSKKVSKDTRNMLKKEDSSKSLGFLKNLKFIFHTK